MVTENFIYSEYNINLVSLNFIINFIAEPAIQEFCIKYNFKVKPKSRDSQRLIIHFIAESLIKQCSRFNDNRNLLCRNTIILTLLDQSLTDTVANCVNKILKKFKICSYSTSNAIDQLTREEIYDCKAIADKCALKTKSLSQVKDFLKTNEITHLHDLIKRDIKTQQTLLNKIT